MSTFFGVGREHGRARGGGVRLTGLVLLFILIALPASGQQSRAEEIAEQQAKKNEQVRPNTPGNTERALDWFEGHFTDPNTFFLTFGGIYPSAGFAPGVAYRSAFGRARLHVGGAYSTKSYKLGHASLRFPTLAGNRIEVDTQARWLDATEVPFYGVGNYSSESDRVSYRLRSTELGGTVTLKPVRWFRIGGGAAWRQVEDQPGLGTHPSIETTYSSETAPGLFSDTRYTRATAFAAVDSRESSGYTRRGGLYSVALSDVRDQDDRFGFTRVDAELRQYIPVLKEHWVFVFRALAQTTAPRSGQEVPYHLLPSLGGVRMHRGYSDFRFQDENLLLFSGEYRWLPSRVLDMALFVDAGKVAAERRDLDFDGLKTAYGIGARFHGPTMVPLRIDVGRSREGIQIHITGGLAF